MNVEEEIKQIENDVNIQFPQFKFNTLIAKGICGPIVKVTDRSNEVNKYVIKIYERSTS